MNRRDRIRAKILANVVVDEDGCHIWQGPTSGRPAPGKTGRGYPRMKLDGGTVAVHKAWWVNEHGIVPPGKQLDHTCRKRLCVTCTELVTHKENCRRRDAARRLTT